MNLTVVHSRNPRALIQDIFPDHVECERRFGWPDLLRRADTAPIKVRCACGKVLKVSLEHDYFNTDGRRDHRRMMRMARSPEGQGVMGFIRSLYGLLAEKK